MSSAVETLLEAAVPARGHSKRSYRPLCACCMPESDTPDGGHLRRGVHRPVLAWRARLAAVQLQAADACKTENLE